MFAELHMRVVRSKLSHCWHRATSPRLKIGPSRTSFSMWILISPGASVHPTETQARRMQQEKTSVTAVPTDPELLRARCKCGTGGAPKCGQVQWSVQICPNPAPISGSVQPCGQQLQLRNRNHTSNTVANVIFFPNLKARVFCAPHFHHFCQPYLITTQPRCSPKYDAGGRDATVAGCARDPWFALSDTPSHLH